MRSVVGPWSFDDPGSVDGVRWGPMGSDGVLVCPRVSKGIQGSAHISLIQGDSYLLKR